MRSAKPPLIVLAGPTASGKSETGLILAEKLGTEIISADSVQIYRDFDIGSAKPSKEQLSRVRHHLIDIADPKENFTAGMFREKAGKIAKKLLEEGKIPLVVGGTGLYIKALVEGLHCGVRISPEAEREIDKIADEKGQKGLYEMARDIDPEWTARIHPNDSFRTRRVIGVYKTTGKRMSDIFRENPSEPAWDALFLVLDLPRSLLYKRIELRVDEMLARGWRDEVTRLKKMGYNQSVKPARSLGYKTLFAESEGGINPGDSARIIKKETKAFAKRQLTWFRKVDDALFIPVGEDESARRAVGRILNNEEVKSFLHRHGASVG